MRSKLDVSDWDHRTCRERASTGNVQFTPFGHGLACVNIALGEIKMIAKKAADLELMTLRAEVERLETALQGAEQGVWDHDLASGTVRYSATWKTLRGYMPDDDVDVLRRDRS